MAHNIFNNGTITGHVGNVRLFKPNADGSRAVALTMYANSKRLVDAQDPSKGTRSDRVDLEGFIPAEAIERARKAGKPESGIYAHLEPGSFISVEFSVRPNDYVDANGVQQYGQKLRVEEVTFLESAATAKARKARRNEAQAQAQAPAAAQG